MKVFKETIECGFKILDERSIVNQELSKEHLPPFNYRISIDYGVVDLALVWRLQSNRFVWINYKPLFKDKFFFVYS